jgi:glycosyltransferase involved in cell wall biosynthesis
MRILLTADPIGGVWNYVLELCAALRPLHGVIALATLGRPLTRAQHEQLAGLDHVTLYESAFRLEWMPQPWEDLARAAEWLLDIEKKFNPDVIHLNHLVHADLPWRAPVVTVGHSCVLSWWKAVRGTTIDAQWSTYRERVTASLRAAACVIAPTHAMLTSLQENYGPFRDCAVIHNARNGRLFSPRQKQPLVLCAGRLWDAAKNVTVLTAVAPRINGRVVVAGEDVGPDGARARISGVELLGCLSPAALASWYARASIYALPARYEPFGLTALEAAWSGCALVLGNIESLRELWGAAACYVSPDDAEGWCDVLNGLLRNDSLRKRMAARAMARARQFAPAELGARYHDIYRNLGCDLRCSTTR